MIGILAYGIGNVQAFANMYERNGIPCLIVKSPADLRAISHLVLPGVGAFDWAMQRLESSGLRPHLDALVRERSTPVLGVCVGMQMLVDRSDEGTMSGLGWIRGEVRHLSERVASLPLPHMGWNDVTSGVDPLFEGTDPAQFYFLHSFHVVPEDPETVIARTSYGNDFVCAIRSGLVAGVQFHPEKSHQWGERLLLNFATS